MKKITKIALIASVALIIIGAAMFGIGYSISGGKLGVVSTSGGLVYQYAAAEPLEKTQLDSFKNIQLSTKYKKVKVVADDGFAIEMDNKKYIEYYVEDDTLHVVESEVKGPKFSLFNFGFGDTEDAIIVYVKKDADLDSIHITSRLGSLSLSDVDGKVVDIYSEFGAVKISNLNTNSLTYKGDSGAARLSNINAGALDIRVEFGAIKMSDIMLKGASTITTTSGAVSADNLTANGLGITTGFGAVALESSDVRDLRVHSDSAAVKFSGKLTGENDFSTEFGSVSLDIIGNAADYSVTGHSEFGRITVDGSVVTIKNYKSDAPNSINIEAESAAGKISFK